MNVPHLLASLPAETWGLFFDMAPYLLLGFLLSGVLYVYLPKERLVRHLGRPGTGSVLKAALLGVPLPLCSCGVIPAALSLRKQGASRGATLSFLISTPQTGVDSILATYSVMGGFFALMRPVFSTLTALMTGLLSHFLDPEPVHEESPHRHAPAPSLFQAPRRLRKVVSYGLRDHLGGVYQWLLVGLLLAALVSLLLPGRLPPDDITHRHEADAVSHLPFRNLGHHTADLLRLAPSSSLRTLLQDRNELLCMLLMVGVGVPLYICATGSIPLAMSFMQAGLSPGAAFVFLMVGPATNVTTIVMAWRYLGRRSTLIYLASIIGIGILSGFVINDLAPFKGDLSLPAPKIHEHGTGDAAGLVGWACALLLAGAIGAAAWIDLRMAWQARLGGSGGPRTLTVPVDGMTCGHCKATVESALRTLPGILHVEANVSAKRVALTLAPLGPSREAIRAAIEGVGYQVPGQGSQFL